jgi:hypothetical protein
MRRDFDETRKRRHDENEDAWEDREFALGGRKLRYLANPPYQATKAIVEIVESDPGLRVFSIVEQAVLSMLESSSRQDFLEVVSSDVDPITWDDLIEVANWLISETTGRPTGRSQSSTGSSSGTGTVSTETSSTALAGASVN